MRRDKELNKELLLSKPGDIIDAGSINIKVLHFEPLIDSRSCSACVFVDTYCPRYEEKLCCEGKVFIKLKKG